MAAGVRDGSGWAGLSWPAMVMNRGEAAMRAEFERLSPVMRSDGSVPSVDHQTPPGVLLADYRIYLRLFDEYARTAVE